MNVCCYSVKCSREVAKTSTAATGAAKASNYYYFIIKTDFAIIGATMCCHRPLPLLTLQPLHSAAASWGTRAMAYAHECSFSAKATATFVIADITGKA